MDRSWPSEFPKRDRVSKTLSDYIWDRDKGICVYCGDYGQEIDHVIPVRYGGPSTSNNLVVACIPCNRKKSDSFDLLFFTKAFKHLLKVRESIDWIDKICLSIINPMPYIHDEDENIDEDNNIDKTGDTETNEEFEIEKDLYIKPELKPCLSCSKHIRGDNFCSDVCEDAYELAAILEDME